MSSMKRTIGAIAASALAIALKRKVRHAMSVMVCALLTLSVCAAEPAAKSPNEQTGLVGGVVVLLGCGDGQMLAELAARDGSHLVQGLDRDHSAVDAARNILHERRLTGPASVRRLDGETLPYADETVNSIVLHDPKIGISPEEIDRVLVPGGSLLAVQAGSVQKEPQWIKPRASDLDVWTHLRYDATGNAASRDTRVGPPRRVRWTAKPDWARSHETTASMPAMVADERRVYYIMDEGSAVSVQLPAHWTLTARDAFNGALLWKVPLGSFFNHFWPLKSGPTVLGRRLVTDGRQVFVVEEINGPIIARDAATGERLRAYAGTENADEILRVGDVLLVVRDTQPKPYANYTRKHSYAWADGNYVTRDPQWRTPQDREIVAMDAVSGRECWRTRSNVVPLTIAANREKVVYLDDRHIVCLSLSDGQIIWKTLRQSLNVSQSGAFAAIWRDVYLVSGLQAFALNDGKPLWKANHPNSTHCVPNDLLVVNNLVWTMDLYGKKSADRNTAVFTGLDPRTGEQKQQFHPPGNVFWFHPRCYPSRSAGHYLLPSRTGIEFVDVEKETLEYHHWTRGGCTYGIMPANGLIYIPPHACACYPDSKTFGFMALAPAGAKPFPAPAAPRLLKGAAFGKDPQPELPIHNSSDWPTYRGNARRSGMNPGTVSAQLNPAWTVALGGRVSPPVIAGGSVFVAQSDRSTVVCLNTVNGQSRWSFAADGLVDSPPTIWNGRAFFGCHDGHIYCLTADAGELVWKYRAAPDERQIVSDNRLASVWPVSGSVLIIGDGGDAKPALYAVAGRNRFLDGGLRLVKLAPATGELLAERVMGQSLPDGKDLQSTIDGLDMRAVAAPDILSSDGKQLFMRRQVFDLDGRELGLGRWVPHLYSSNGYLDDSWSHRVYWLYGAATSGGWGSWFRPMLSSPSGRILAMNDQTVFGYGRMDEYKGQSTVLEYRLFAANREPSEKLRNEYNQAEKGFEPILKDIEPDVELRKTVKNGLIASWQYRKQAGDRGLRLSAIDYRWKVDKPPFIARAMALAGDKLLAAGPPDCLDEERAFHQAGTAEMLAATRRQDEAVAGRHGALFWIMDAASGKKLTEIELAVPPVFDGLAVVNGRAIISLINGEIMCLNNANP